MRTVKIRTTGASWEYDVSEDNAEKAVKRVWELIGVGAPLQMRVSMGDTTIHWVVLNHAHVIHVITEA